MASYLAEFVAETLRAARTSQGALLTDEENIHLLGANYWVQPIYQELLHAASGHNASAEGERKRPCSGLVKIIAKQRRAKTRAPVVNTACVSDGIGGFCPADSLMIWFPAHWAPQVIKELERREQDHRQGPHNGLMTGFRTSTGNNTKMRVTVALSISKNAHTSRALFSSLLPQSELIGFPCRFKALWIVCRTYDRA